MKVSSSFLVTAVLISQIASADILDKDKFKTYNRISVERAQDRDGNELVSFSLCSKLSDECEQLGDKKFYSIKELSKQRKLEYLQTLPSVGGLLVTAAVGWEAGILAGLGGPAFIAYLGGIGLPIVSAKVFESLNPLVQLKQGYNVRNSVLEDEDVEAGDVVKTAKLITSVLNKLDGTDVVEGEINITDSGRGEKKDLVAGSEDVERAGSQSL